MKRKLLSLITILFASVFALSACAEKGIQGAWKPSIYYVDGVETPIDGLIIITDKYFSSNIVYQGADPSAGPVNANSDVGKYAARDGKIFLEHWVQLHHRSQPTERDPQIFNTYLKVDFEYELEDNTLKFKFPNGNYYLSERLK